MADNFQFEDYRVQVKAALNEKSLGFLYDVGDEIAARASDDCNMTTEDHGQLKQSYRRIVDESKFEVKVGSPLESAFWEEFGTGEWAATDKNGGRPGRSGWWVYVEGGSGYTGPTAHYNSEKEAEAVAAGMRAQGFKAVATNGRKPSFTLENAFDSMKGAIKRRAEQLFGELGK